MTIILYCNNNNNNNNIINNGKCWAIFGPKLSGLPADSDYRNADYRGTSVYAIFNRKTHSVHRTGWLRYVCMYIDVLFCGLCNDGLSILDFVVQMLNGQPKSAKLAPGKWCTTRPANVSRKHRLLMEVNNIVPSPTFLNKTIFAIFAVCMQFIWIIWVFWVVTPCSRVVPGYSETSRLNNSATQRNNPEDLISWDCVRWRSGSQISADCYDRYFNG